MTPNAALKRLGLAAGADVAAIRKAYAERFKAMDVDADPEGYARLRQARDIALRAAKAASAKAQAGVADEAAPVAEETAEESRAWPYGAPSFPVATAADAPLLVAGQVPHTKVEPKQPKVIEGPAIGPAALAALAGATGMTLPAGTRADVSLLVQPDRDLARLLHTRSDENGAFEALSDSEEAYGERCLGALLADAARSDLTRQGLVEDWLADLLADTWPRSAPLLKLTAEAFGWENERGQLRERPSIAWLNARLRGLRFHEKVTRPEHVLHKAWAELSRPGPSTMIDRMRVKRGEVNQLLEGVRKHFPELEQHLASDRVASWEAAASQAGGRRFGEFRILGTGLTYNFSYAFFVIIGLNVLRVIIESLSGNQVASPNQLLGPPALVAPADPQYERIRDAAVIEVFGKDKTIAWLRENQASLATDFEARLRAARSSGRDEAGAVADGLEMVRRRVFLDGRTADAPFLREMTRIRLAQIDAASKQGPEACAQLVRAADVKGLTVPEAVRVQERALAVKMVSAGILGAPQEPLVKQARIPGDFVEQAMKATGLPENRVRLVLRDKGSPAEQCAVTGALLRAALKSNLPERLDILMVM